MAGLFCLLLISCSGEQKKQPEPGDGPSTLDLKAADVADAVPRAEPLARYGNHSPYEVFGKKYKVMPSNKDYHEQGVASWYGSKFHGRRTSSGEPYDMHRPRQRINLCRYPHMPKSPTWIMAVK